MFDGGPAQSLFEKLLQHECHLCNGSKTYQTFQLLKDHMRKKHELFYCDLCVDNLKVFVKYIFIITFPFFFIVKNVCLADSYFLLYLLKIMYHSYFSFDRYFLMKGELTQGKI